MKVNVNAMFPRAAVLFSILLPGQLSAVDIPALTWTQRSDWVNVVTQGADPTGVNNSTSAIQSALNQVSNNGSKTGVYFPAGTYKITSTLTLSSTQGSLLVGCGRNTTLKWFGSSGGIMFRSNGNNTSRFIGLVWNGNSASGNGASIGIDHGKDYLTNNYFETRCTHMHEKFMNFTVTDPTNSDPNYNKAAGIRVGRQEYLGDGMNYGTASAEILYSNCYFVNNTTGVSLISYNSLDNSFSGCEFQSNSYGIYSPRGNQYVRDCHFSGSTVADYYQGFFSCSVRRCTSTGSARFVVVAGPTGAGTPITIHDCRVNGWTNATSAIDLCSPGPDIIADCVFTNPPNANPPIRLNQMSEWAQQVILSNNSSSGTLVAPGPWGIVTDVGAGAYGGWTTSYNQSFLRDTAEVEGAVYDAVSGYGADNTGAVDATTALQNCINAAKNAGNGAVAYIPRGIYKISSTLNITGSNYTVSGSGFRTEIRWNGGTSGTMISVVDPQAVRLANFHIWPNTGDTSAYDGVCRIRQTSSTGGASSIKYDFITFGGYDISPRTRTLRGLECASLPTGAQVIFEQNCGNIDLIDCGRATILGTTHYDGRIIVEGSIYAKTGLTGFLTFFGSCNDTDIFVKDNQDLTIDDYYAEGTDHCMSISRNSSGFSTGHVTVQTCKQHNYFNAGGGEDPYYTINNYAGRLFCGRGNFVHHVTTPPPPNYYFYIDHSGTQPCDMVFGAALFFKAMPTFREFGSGMTTHLLNCLRQYENESNPPNGGRITNVTNANTNGLIRQALDDSRLLGKCDLDLNYFPALITDDGTAAFRDDYNGTVGQQFTVGASNLTVTQLGYYDDDVDGNAVSHQVGLWTDAGVLLGSVTVQAGTASPLSGEFRYVNLGTPITLTAGQTYRLGAFVTVNCLDRWHGEGAGTCSSSITVKKTAFVPSSFQYPDLLGAGAGNSFIGPNMRWSEVWSSPLIADDGTAAFRDDYNGTVGQQFTVGASNITVTQLGYYDDDVDGNAVSHQVGLWTDAGALLGSVTVQAGTASRLSGEFRYENLGTPITLTAGQTYRLGAFVSVNCLDRWHGEGAGTCSSAVTVKKTAWVPSSFQYPDLLGAGAGNSFIGPNMKW